MIVKLEPLRFPRDGKHICTNFTLKLKIMRLSIFFEYEFVKFNETELQIDSFFDPMFPISYKKGMNIVTQFLLRFQVFKSFRVVFIKYWNG